MGKPQYPDNLPEELQTEYLKYIADPKRYEKLHPVCFKIIKTYLESTNGKPKRNMESSKNVRK